MTSFDKIVKKVERYYSDKIITYGPTPQGVDWSSPESQFIRFKQLLKVCDDNKNYFSINDYGCGYGALLDYMHSQNYQFSYFGYDISTLMLDEANKRYGNYSNVVFCHRKSDLPVSDYTVASGIC